MSARVSFSATPFLTAALITLTPAAAAAQITPYCGPVDVVFAIDDTASMYTELVSAQPGAFKTRIPAILDRIQACSDRDPLNNRYDYRLALVTFKDDIAIRHNFSANNRSIVEPTILGLFGSGGNREADASDEAIRTIVQALPAAGRLGPDGTQRQDIDFFPAFRPHALKIIILVTDDPPGGFYDNNDAVRDLEARLRADEAAAAGIRIVSVFTPEQPYQDAAAPTMRYYADATHVTAEDQLRAFVNTDVPHAGDGILAYLEALPALNRPPVARCTDRPFNVYPACQPVAADIDFGSYDPDGSIASRVQSPAGPYPHGVTTVTLTVTDNQDGTDSCSAQVDVFGCEPVFNLPAAIDAEATSAAGAVVSYPPVTAEDYSGTPIANPVTCMPASGSVFPLGATSVVCEVTDSHGITGRDSFTVTVTDTTPPALTVPASVSVPATSGSGAVVTYTATATDIVDGAVTPVCSPASGSQFSVGATTVTCTAADTRGNSGSGSFTVTVTAGDTSPPTVTVPASMVLEATGPSGAIATFTASAADDVDGPLPATCTPASGGTFPIAATTVTCSATDSHGNTGSASFTVTVRDATPPAVSVPPNATLTTTTNAPVAHTFAATAMDLVDGPLVPICIPPSGSLFPVGATTVTCTASDSHGNAGSASFTVTVTLVDTTAPVVTVPDNMIVEASGPAGAVVTFSASATDNVDGTVPATCMPASGSTFPIDRTTVTCSSSDGHGNTGSASFDVRVHDTTRPTVTVPADVTILAPTRDGVPYTFTATASDVVDGAIATICTPASGSVFPVGTTTVTCTATDAHDNVGSASFVVTVVLDDSTPPVVTVPAPMTVEATRAGGAIAIFTASALDNLDGPLTPTCVPASGSTFPLGTTTVTCTATDAHGNVGTASFTVTVVDTTPPLIAVPTDTTLAPTGPDGATFTYTATAVDVVDGTVAVGCTPASGSLFPIGMTTVTCTATDAAGNFASRSFRVTVAVPPPDPPAAVQVVETARVSATIAWMPGADNRAVAYRIYELELRGNRVIWRLVADGVQALSYVIDRISRPNAVHTYAVTAVDAAGLESVRSAPVEVLLQRR